MSVEWRADRSLVAEQFGNDATELLDADEGDWVVTCGARDPAVEAAGYAKWLADKTQPKYTNPDNSAHCKVPAEAIDVTLREGGTDNWDYQSPPWRRLVEKVKAHPRLHSLDSIGDTDHIEAVNWRNL